MKDIRHEEFSREHFYQDLANSLDYLAEAYYQKGNNHLRFIIPIICAAKLEAFINIAGKLNIGCWDEIERNLSFKKKCLIICEKLKKAFDPKIEPNKTVIYIFKIRNDLVHPKLLLKETDELINEEEYDRRSTSYNGVNHPLRSNLNEKQIKDLISRSNKFIDFWGKEFFENPGYMLRTGSTGSFTRPYKPD